jgi:hypothetical protein
MVAPATKGGESEEWNGCGVLSAIFLPSEA